METFNSSWIVFSLTGLIMKVLCNTHPVEVSYDELVALGANCHPLDICQRNETDLELNPRSCDCDSSCSIYGTCCVDSEFKIHKMSPKHKSNMKCLTVYNRPEFQIFMVDGCKNDETSDNLCYGNPEESNDPFLIIPVTSNVTGITYKNYFCAVCNEDVDSEQLEFWEMQILVSGTQFKNFSGPQLEFNKTMGSWTVNDDKNNDTSNAVPVTLKIQENLKAPVRHCAADLIENCSSNWTDGAVELKCRDYMAIVFGFLNVRYKNPHCALCNFVNLTNIWCFKFQLPGIHVKLAVPSNSVGVDIPLINLFVLEDRQKRCGKSMVYDKFADKCRCNSKIYTKVNGKCVHKI